jgi:hypothetical protein
VYNGVGKSDETLLSATKLGVNLGLELEERTLANLSVNTATTRYDKLCYANCVPTYQSQNSLNERTKFDVECLIFVQLSCRQRTKKCKAPTWKFFDSGLLRLNLSTL